MSWFGDKLSLTRGALVHHLRHAWVRTKDIIGLPRVGTDRSFFLAEFVRRLRRGELGRNVRITAAGKTDGGGAQALAQISAMAFAAAFGLEYVHSPFRVVCHVEGPKDQWAQSWEKNLNFGHGHSQIDSCGLPVLPLGDFLKYRSLWKKDCVVQLIHYQQWTNDNTWAYAAVTPQLRDDFYLDKTPARNERRVVAVHIRRGDVSETRSANTHFTPNPPIAATLHQVVAILRNRGEDPVIRIFSQGAPEDFKEFSAFGAEFHLDSPAIWTFNQLVEADVLIMARSAFSFVAGILSDGVKLYEPFQEHQLPDWIVRDAAGHFDEAIFNKQLDLLRAKGSKEATTAALASPPDSTAVVEPTA